MITCNVVDILCDKVFSINEQIRFASAVTLGYLTFNRTASRLLLHNCRNKTNLFKTLMDNLRDDSKINEDFLLNYDTALKLGLPKLLVHNKVRFMDPIKTDKDRHHQRVKTAHPLIPRKITIYNRAVSAPQSKTIDTKMLNTTRPRNKLNSTD